MKKMGIFLLILCSYLGCTKESTTTVVALELKQNHIATLIEWNNTSGSYIPLGGKLIINGECVTGEIFKLALENVTDTGIIDNLNIQQIYFAMDGEFNPSHLQKGKLQIDKFTNSHIQGNFNATLSDALAEMKIEGKFVMHLGRN
jgi:hypothetical protein